MVSDGFYNSSIHGKLKSSLPTFEIVWPDVRNNSIQFLYSLILNRNSHIHVMYVCISQTKVGFSTSEDVDEISIKTPDDCCSSCACLQESWRQLWASSHQVYKLCDKFEINIIKKKTLLVSSLQLIFDFCCSVLFCFDVVTLW